MNWQHFRAFAWLRWRLMANQWRRAGALNAALMIVFSVGALASAIPLFLGCFAAGTYLIPRASPDQLMYAWDGLIFLFAIFWVVGLMVDLQRNDPLSLSKFLHLPVSVQGAFLINYLSSLLRLSLLAFVPAMAGFALALVYVQGVAQLPVLPGLAAFLLMVTAPTYQFQGWLASLVGDPRRRRAVVVGTTIAFILVFQLPNLVHLYTPQIMERQAARAAAQAKELAELGRALQAKEIDAQELGRRQTEVLDRYAAEGKRESLEEVTKWARIARVANMVIPLGWLPMGVMASAEGNPLPSILGLLGMTLIGSTSLWLAYRSTIGQFQGRASGRARARATVAREAARPSRVRGELLEARLPGLSEPVSAIALGCFRSLLRSPEAKLSLLTPLILGAVMGTMVLRGRAGIPEGVRPLAGVAAIVFVLFGMMQLMANQFGVDRDGFRVFVLCSAPRRDILLGKNLAYLPPAALLSAVLLAVVQFLSPMRLDHALSMVPQFASMFLLLCPLANLSSICAPFYMAPGVLKPANPKFTTILFQMALFLVLFPIAQGLTLIPLGVEAALHAQGWDSGVPVCLLLSTALCAAVILLYWASLGWFGGLLQAREQKILEPVTNGAA